VKAPYFAAGRRTSHQALKSEDDGLRSIAPAIEEANSELFEGWRALPRKEALLSPASPNAFCPSKG